MQNVVSAVFKTEEEAKEALKKLKKEPVTDAYAVSQGALIKKEGNGFKVLGSFDSGLETSNDTIMGGLVGGLVGLLGGPIGALLVGATGALAGSVVDAADSMSNESILEKVTEQFTEGEISLIALAQNEKENALEDALTACGAEVITEDAAEVMQEIKHAEEVADEMEQEARKRLREQREEEWKKSAEEWGKKMEAEFEELKKKFKK